MEQIFLILLYILQALLSILVGIWNLIVDLCCKAEGAHAQYGSLWSISKPWHKGFVLSSMFRLSKRKSRENILLVGPTGSGKSVRIILRNLLKLKGVSMIVSDPSMELFISSSAYLSQYYNIKAINFSDAAVSVGFNILAFITKSTDVSRIASLLVLTGMEHTGNSDPFWQIQSVATLEILIELVLYQPKEVQSMTNVSQLLHILSSDSSKIDALIAKTQDAKLITKYKSLISTNEKTLQAILSSTKAAIRIFEDDQVAKITSTNSVNFQEFREKPTILFLHNSISEQKYLKVLNSLFFEVFYGAMLKKLPNKNDLDIMVILDEASSLNIPILSTALSNCRKMKVSTLVAVQCVSQLKTFYGTEAPTLVSNCLTRIYLPGITSIETLKEIELLSGKCTYKDEKSGVERMRPLITCDEIRLLRKNKALVISGNAKIIKMRTRPYFRSLILNRYAKMPPCPLIGDVPDTPSALIV